MKLKRMAAGMLAALTIIATPGVIQSAQAVSVPASTSASSASSASIKAYNVKVTAYSLNVRQSASAKAKITAVLKKGNTVTITDEKKVNSTTTWGKTSKGWINLNYTQKITKVNYTGKINVPSLNVRKNADNTSKVVKVLKQNTKVTIIDEKKDSRNIVWGKVKEANGWINLDFIQTAKTIKVKVQVTAAKTTTRQFASISAKTVTTLKKGAVVDVVAAQKDSRDVTWAKLANGKGWISMEDAKKVDTFKSYKVKVTSDSLTIRQSPNINAKAVGWLKKGAVVTVTAAQKDSRGVTWGKTSKGWISFKYCKKA